MVFAEKTFREGTSSALAGLRSRVLAELCVRYLHKNLAEGFHEARKSVLLSQLEEYVRFCHVHMLP